jgi:hypothetical protein
MFRSIVRTRLASRRKQTGLGALAEYTICTGTGSRDVFTVRT